MSYKIGQRVDYILDACRGKQVLHLGCADTPYTQLRLNDGTLLYTMIEDVAEAQYGVDLSAEGIEFLKRCGYQNLAVADVEHLATENPFGQVDFDVIVAGEIIEHLSNPGLFLDSLKRLLRKPSAKLVLTTINAYCAYRFCYSLLMREESVHPDHVSYFSRKTLTRMLAMHDYEVEDFSFYPIGREHEQYINKGRTQLLWLVDRLAYKFSPLLADGVMVTCSLREER